MGDQDLDLKLGDKEGPALEFKDTRALNDPAKLARGVVAMLNSGGGTIYIGVSEEQERAIGFQHVENHDFELTRLRDCFNDRIKPAPSSGEIQLDSLRAREQVLLRIRATPHHGRQPYAWVDGQRSEFVERFGSRTRHMSYDDIVSKFQRAAAFQGNSAAQRQDEAEKRRKWAEDWLEWRTNKRGALALVVLPVPALELATSAQVIRPLFTDAAKSGNRPSGCSFVNRHAQILDFLSTLRGRRVDGIVSDSSLEPSQGHDPNVLGEPAQRSWLLTDGALLVEDSLARFDARLPDTKGLKTFHPELIIEFAVSVLRLAGTLYRHRAPSKVCIWLRSGPLEGWQLPPYGSESVYWVLNWHNDPSSRQAGGTARLLDLVLETDGERLVQEPDAVGWDLVVMLYKTFQHAEEAIPSRFERSTRRLRLEGTPAWPVAAASE